MFGVSLPEPTRIDLGDALQVTRLEEAKEPQTGAVGEQVSVDQEQKPRASLYGTTRW